MHDIWCYSSILNSIQAISSENIATTLAEKYLDAGVIYFFAELVAE